MHSMRWFMMILGTILCALMAMAVPPGYDAASFARMGIGVRAQAMGGAFVSIAQGATAGYWNPAGLGYMKDFQIEAMYTDWLGAGIDFQYISLAGAPPVGNKNKRLGLSLEGRPLVLGLTWISTHIGGIPHMEENGVYGTFDAWSHLFILSAGWQLEQTPSVSVGLNLKLYHDRILEGRSFGLGGDVGLLWKGVIGDIPLSVGVMATDVGDTEIRWYGTTGEPLNYVPWLVKVGAAAKMGDSALFAVSYEWGVRRPRFDHLRVGMELSLTWFALRAGYVWSPSDNIGQWAIGGGINYKGWALLDYSYVATPLGGSYLVALGFRW